MDYRRRVAKSLDDERRLDHMRAKFDRFEDLLEYSRQQLDRYREIHETGEEDSDFDNPTGYEDQLLPYIDPMIQINKHMFTTYSTNFYDGPLSLEGTIRVRDYERIRDDIDRKGWHCMAITINRRGVYPTVIDINFDVTGVTGTRYFLVPETVSLVLTTMHNAEFLDNVSSAVDPHQFVQLSLEDPVSDRKTLYEELVQILETRLT